MMTKNGGSDAVWAFAEHEHHELVSGINRIHEVGCEIGRRPTPELAIDVLNILTWIDGSLAPHIAWEEGWLYPEIDSRSGTPWATRLARFDHQQIRIVAARLRTDHPLLLGGDSSDAQVETRCDLFSLEALLRAHIEREERFLIPLLDDELATDASPELEGSIGGRG